MSEDQTTQYLLREPLDRPAGPLSAENLCALILQGRVFGTDWVQIGANAPVQLQSLEVFHSTLYQAIGHEVQGAWSGQIHPVQVAELFGYIFNHKLSGYLIVQTNENAQKSITFKDGYPINAFSNVIGEDIKTYFINKGLLDENIYNQIISNQFSQCIDLYQAINQLAIDQSAFKKTLSVLTLTRVINLFSLKAGVWNFISAEIKETEEILSQIDIKNLIQTALSTSIDVNEATAALVPYSDQVFYVDSATSQHFAMDDVDQKVFTLLNNGLTLRQMIPQFEQNLSIQSKDARIRLVILQKLGVIKTGQQDATSQQTSEEKPKSNSALDELKTLLSDLKKKNYFDILEVRRVARSDEINEALQVKLQEYKAITVDGDDQIILEQRNRIKEFLEKIAHTLIDDDERDLYERALKLGQSLDDMEVRNRLKFDQLEYKGRMLITQQQYDQAFKMFEEASEFQPQQPLIHLSMGWAFFLDSDQDEDDAEKAIEYVNRAIEIAPELDKAYLTAGKIYRISGEKVKSEKNLRKAISLNPHNNEAHSELRLLFSREITKKKGPKKKKSSKKKSENVKSKSSTESSDVSPAVLFGLSGFLIVGLFLGSNFISGGLKHWPDVQDVKAQSQGENEVERAFLSETRERFQKSEDDLKVPVEKQVIGNSEYFYYPDDSWWWIRRISLLLFGLLGIFLINKDKIEDIKWFGASPQYFFYAIPYGLIAGYASGVPQVVPGLSTLLLMSLVHVLSEQIFFIVFAGRGFFKAFKDPKIAIGAITLIYSLYQFTFFATINQPIVDMLISIAQVTVFAGAIYALLLFKSGGVLSSFVAQFIIVFIMMIRSTLN